MLSTICQHSAEVQDWLFFGLWTLDSYWVTSCWRQWPLHRNWEGKRALRRTSPCEEQGLAVGTGHRMGRGLDGTVQVAGKWAGVVAMSTWRRSWETHKRRRNKNAWVIYPEILWLIWVADWESCLLTQPNVLGGPALLQLAQKQCALESPNSLWIQLEPLIKKAVFFPILCPTITRQHLPTKISSQIVQLKDCDTHQRQRCDTETPHVQAISLVL